MREEIETTRSEVLGLCLYTFLTNEDLLADSGHHTSTEVWIINSESHGYGQNAAVLGLA